MGSLETLYLILFIVGVIYAVITIFLGDIFNLQFDAGGGQLPYLSPTTIGAFVTTFGGVGYYLSMNAGWGAGIIALIALISALFLSSLMFFFVVLPLMRADKSAAKSAEEMIGKTAEVVTIIMDGSKGEIVYEQGGVRLSAPARIVDSGLVRQGEIVRIIDVISGTFIVEKLDTGKENQSLR